MTNPKDLAANLIKALETLPEHLREEMTDKLNGLLVKTINKPSNDENAFKQHIMDNFNLGEAMYDLAHIDAPDDVNIPDFEELTTFKKVFWTMLALRSNFNPSNARCVCSDCMNESSCEDDSENNPNTGMLKVSDAEVVDLIQNNKLPRELVNILKAKGLDPSNFEVKVVNDGVIAVHPKTH